MDVTLLGPQRKAAAARAAVAELMPEGPIATINAGWQEREADAAELDSVLGGRMRNLELYRRWSEVIGGDAEYAEAERHLDVVLEELQGTYAMRLQHAMAALEAVSRRDAMPELQSEASEDALQVVRALDLWHLRMVGEARADFYSTVRLGERDTIARHRAEIAHLVDPCTGMVFAGGHVGVLLHLLHVFGVARMLQPPVVAWSAGAMALSDRVVLYHDHGPVGRRHPEVYAHGLSVYARVLPFPHARSRLRLDDAEHLGIIARRFAPRTCLLLGDGERVPVGDHTSLPSGARTLTDRGIQVLADDRGVFA